MTDEHSRDLEIERQDRIIILENLEKRLLGITDKKTKQNLKDWMQGVSEGTEHEAQQLLTFFRAWASANDFTDARTFREEAVKCGLSRAVDLHFTALSMKQRVIGSTSLELLRWAIYGHWGCTRQEKQEDYIKRMAQAEAIHEHRTGEKMSVASLSRSVGIDRKTVRDKKCQDGYPEMVSTIKEVLKRSDR